MREGHLAASRGICSRPRLSKGEATKVRAPKGNKQKNDVRKKCDERSLPSSPKITRRAAGLWAQYELGNCLCNSASITSTSPELNEPTGETRERPGHSCGRAGSTAGRISADHRSVSARSDNSQRTSFRCPCPSTLRRRRPRGDTHHDW